MRNHYEGYGRIVHERLRLDEVDYMFDLNPEHGIYGYVLSLDGRLPAQPTTLILRLEQSDLFVAVYLSQVGFDIDLRKFRYELTFSKDQPDDPNNLAASRQ